MMSLLRRICCWWKVKRSYDVESAQNADHSEGSVEQESLMPDDGNGIYKEQGSKRKLLRKQNASQSENAAEDHTSPKQHPSRRSVPNDAHVVQDQCWTEDDGQGRRKETITTPLPRQNASASESVAESDTSLVHRRGRRFSPKAADMQPRDNHWAEGDKPILSNSHSRSDHGVVAGIEPHDSLKSGCDSISPASDSRLDGGVVAGIEPHDSLKSGHDSISPASDSKLDDGVVAGIEPHDSLKSGHDSISPASDSKLDDGVVAGIEPHGSLKSGHDSRSPATAMAVADDDGAAAADTSRASIDGEQMHEKLDVDEYLWKYIEKYHMDVLQSICSTGVTYAYAKNKIEIIGQSREAVSAATEEVAALYQKLADHVAKETFPLPQGTHEDMLPTDVKDLAQNEKLLFCVDHDSICQTVGSKDKISVLKQRILDVISVSVNRIEGADRKLEHTEASKASLASESKSDGYTMITPGGIIVEVYQGDLIAETVDAIVNPANSHLRHGGGAARVIADAAGLELEEECKNFLRRHKYLNVTEVMHTSAGKLQPKINYVIHAVGPRAAKYPDQTELFHVLRQTFINCFRHADSALHVSSLSLPAISSGNFGVDKTVVAQAAYQAVMMFDTRTDRQHLKTVRFVNFDAPTTSVFVAVCKSLHESSAAAVEVVGKREMDEAKSAEGGGLQSVPDTLKKWKTSETDNSVDAQLQTAGQSDAVQSESFTVSPRSLTAAEGWKPVAECADQYKMVTPGGVAVEIYRGNLLDEKVDAIVNPANSQLLHGGGAARVIAEAAGSELQDECRAYISEHNELKVTQAMHTTAGRLNPPVVYVIHVVGPSAADFSDPVDLHQAVFDSFYNCLLHANNHLEVSSMSIPAISSGVFGVEKPVVAKAAYGALTKFDDEIRAGMLRKIQCIHYVNLDAESTMAFVEAFSKPQSSRQVGEVGATRDFYSDNAAASFDPKQVSAREMHVENLSVPPSSRMATGEKRQRRLKVTDGVAAEADSAAKKQKMSTAGSNTDAGPAAADEDEDCVICMCPMTQPKKLACGHSFCADCIDESFQKCQPKCPSCGRLFGVMKGNQPPGTMTVLLDTASLPGFGHCGTLLITYSIPSGTQNDTHPNPGERYHGTRRSAYLPDNAEGNEICRMLRQAFDAGLIFTVGRSNTTGHDNAVIWNDIHHKTSTSGQFGYPDPTYLARVKDELAAKGIVSGT